MVRPNVIEGLSYNLAFDSSLVVKYSTPFLSGLGVGVLNPCTIRMLSPDTLPIDGLPDPEVYPAALVQY